MIDFTLTKQQHELREGLNQLGRYVIRPMSLEMDKNKEVPEGFLRNFMKLSKSVRNDDVAEFTEEGAAQAKPRDPSKPSQSNRTAAVGAEGVGRRGEAHRRADPPAGQRVVSRGARRRVGGYQPHGVADRPRAPLRRPARRR